MPRLAVVTALAAAFLAGCGEQTEQPATPEVQAEAQSQTQVETQAPESGSPEPTEPADRPATIPSSLKFEATTADGERFDPATLAGAPVVFWFWAPWCPTCRAQAPGVQALAKEHGEKVGIVGVGSLDEADAIKGFADDHPGITQLTDPDGAVWRHFGVTAQSTYLVLDDRGRTVESGYLDDDELAEVVDDLAG